MLYVTVLIQECIDFLWGYWFEFLIENPIAATGFRPLSVSLEFCFSRVHIEKIFLEKKMVVEREYTYKHETSEVLWVE